MTRIGLGLGIGWHLLGGLDDPDRVGARVRDRGAAEADERVAHEELGQLRLPAVG